MESLLTTCLAKICEEMGKEADLDRKMNLVKEVTEFLLTTPDVFASSDDASAISGMNWRRSLYTTATHLLSSKLPSKDRREVFQLISSLVLGFGRINWFMQAKDGEWSSDDVKYYNLLSRYTCIEIVMLLDQVDVDSEFLASLLIILEHCLLCLVECDAVSSQLSPDHISALIVSIRSVAMKMMEFADLHKDEDRYTLVIKSMIRLLCLWIEEDNEGVSVEAGNLFPGIVVTILKRSEKGIEKESQELDQSADSHNMLHAAVTSISILPKDCVPAVKECERDIMSLLCACQENPNPDSNCKAATEVFLTFTHSFVS